MNDVRTAAIPSAFQRWWASWRLALRINRREAGQSKLRAAFIALTVSLPVLLMAAAATYQQSEYPSNSTEVLADLGTADARVTVTKGIGGTTPADRSGQWSGLQRRVSSLLPGAQVTPVSTESVSVVNDDRWFERSVISADLRRDPARSMVQLISGRLPTRAGEVVVTPSFRRELHGDHLQLRVNSRGYPATVVGVVGAKGEVIAHPGTVPRASVPDFLVTRSTPFTLAEIHQAGRAGLGLRSRTEPQIGTHLQPYRSTLDFGITLIMVLGAFEVALLTAPAFTVGALRARQSLAQFVLNGAERKQVRRVMLGQAVLLGWIPALIGAVAGVVLGWGMAIRNASRGSGLPVERGTSWAVLLLAVGCAFVAAFAGAAWPMRGTEKLEVSNLLRHRPPSDRVHRRVPVVALSVAGFFLILQLLSVLWDWRTNSSTLVPWARLSLLFTVAAVISVMFAVPWVLSVLSTSLRGTPIAARVAARDVLRHRSRSVSAVSAIIAAFSVLTTFWILIAAESSVGSVQTSEGARASESPAAWTRLHGLPADRMAIDRVRSSLTGTTVVPVYAPSRSVHGASVKIVRPAGVPEASGGNLAGAASDLQGVRREDVSSLPFTANEQAVLSAGGVVNVPSSWIQKGHVAVGRDMPDRNVPAVARDGSSRLGDYMFVLDRTMKAWGQPVESSYFLINGKMTEDRASRLEHSFPDSYLASPPVAAGTTAIQLLTGGMALVLAVFAAVSATVLSQAEQQRDLSTLRALGASAGLTRRVGAAQAGLITVAGTVLGVGIGVIPGVAYAVVDQKLPAGEHLPAVVKARVLDAVASAPWGWFLVVGLFTILLAAAFGWLLGGSRRAARRPGWVVRQVSPAE